MTPYEVGILLHYYGHARDPVEGQFDMRAPIWRPTITWFINMGLIEHDKSEGTMRSYRLTDKGRCYVEDGICNVRLPEPKWHIPHVCPAP
jgi:hypothetical protein